jgi:Mrp family chromosome partitioning ATPase
MEFDGKMRFIRRKNSEIVETQPLVLTGEDGETLFAFPEEVVNAVRQTIARLMRTNPFPDKLAITSAVRQEGVTYLSRAIGTVLANDMARKVCVVELNWWWPTDDPKTANGRPGVAEILLGDATLEEAQFGTGLDNLTLIPAGKLVNNRRSTVSHSDELAALITTLDKKFDHVIYDLPAITVASDTILLASHSTAVCLVVRQGVTPVQSVKGMLDDLDHLNIVGVIMNQVNVATPSFLLDYIVQG